jgi:phosphinothricin acetyltransferase
MLKIRGMRSEDAAKVLRIYGEGIATGHATFEQDVPAWPAFDAGKLEKPRLVAELNDDIVGWAALSPVSSRCVYGGVGEMSVYVAEAARGRGVGRALLEAIITASEAEGIWMLNAGIFVENTASIALHEACGFNRLGVQQGLGKMGFGPMQGKWRDVVLLQRRSRVVGVD